MTSTADRYRANANALVRNPDDPLTLVDQLSVLSEKKQNDIYYKFVAKRAYELDPTDILVAFNYGSALHRAGEWQHALRMFRACEKLEKDEAYWRPVLIHHQGICYRSLGQNEKAVECYTKAHELTGDPAMMKDLALAILATGDLKLGWEKFEARKAVAAKKFYDNDQELIAQHKLPDGVVHWKGENLTGKKVVVFHEEGAGDFIMVSRFIPRLRDLGVASIVLTGVNPDLLELVAQNIEVDGIVPIAGPFDCDYVVGSMSVTWRTGVTYADVKGEAYFHAEPAKLPKRGALNVGLVWRGNPAYGQDIHRSLPFGEYARLFDLPGVAFHSLQAGAPWLEVTDMGLDGFVANLEPFCANWQATARVIQALDVVVTVDTACAHLAGALGKPVFMLVTESCDWRWDRNSERTPWYDSMRVIRQVKQDEWEIPILRVRDKLRSMRDVRRQAA